MARPAFFRGSHAIAAAAASVATVGAVASCSLVISTDNLTGGMPAACDGGACTEPPMEASTVPMTDGATCDADTTSDVLNCGGCGMGCSPHNACVGGKCVPGCPGNIVYVSATGGSDSNSGCTPATAMQTISGAISAVNMISAVGQEIHVCAGDYVEAGIALEYPVSLLGGYNCTTWKRTATFGYPKFDGVDLTRIEVMPNATSGTALTVSGKLVLAANVVEGFTIVGPSNTIGNTESIALEVDDNTSVTVRNNVVSGATGTAAPTVGMVVQFNATPEVTGNEISGGGGSAAVTGLRVSGMASPSVHENAISAGNASAGAATAMLVTKAVSLSGSRAIRNNTITGGSGMGSGTAAGSVGLYIDGTTVDVIGNQISGGAAKCTSGSCVAYGVFAASNNFGATIAGNRILGGSSAGGSSQLIVGLSLQQTAAPWVVNNAIQAGAPSGMTATGLALVQGSGGVIQQNTIFGSTGSMGLQGAAGVFVQNNLLLSDAVTSTAAISLDSCNKAFGVTTLASFTNNEVVNVGATVATRSDLNGSTCNTTKFPTIGAFQTALAMPATAASGNGRVASNCAQESNCTLTAACTPTQSSEAACIGTVLGTWDDPTQGVIDLTDSTRSWALGSGAPCTIAQGGGAVLSDPLAADGGSYDDTVDLMGQKRTAPVSIGAYENDVQCAQ